jgi:hypothetical protein
MSEIRNDYQEVNGVPGGGFTTGEGFHVKWRGPIPSLGPQADTSGATVEDVLGAVIARLSYYQSVSGGRFSCHENASALSHLTSALAALHARTAARMRRKAEGSEQP